MAGFKSAAKRKRELAKLDKRTAKDQKRAVRKAAERARVEPTAPALATNPTTQLKAVGQGVAADTAATRKPLTLAEAVERWKATKVGDPKTLRRGTSGRRS